MLNYWATAAAPKWTITRITPYGLTVTKREPSMESDKVNRWLTLGANIGVLIGIILLVVELNQNRDMIRAQTRNDISQQVSNRLLSVGTNSQMASVMRRATGGEELTADEEYQAYLYLVANMRDWENIHYQYRHGMFDEQEFDAEKFAWRWVINNSKVFERNWCRIRQNYSAEFLAELESLLEEDVCAAPQDD